eukprot:TRINITY_DN1365_c0_g1_i4.p1 TRINITY_DN1365_c0_g1~~TRINITY_DN1365_c0_g1_i4.p1  ORF type:complete len:879 (+),score=189.03 TRINITY_DN1365_c0_g1_i4:167-2803(+)
MGDGLKPRRIVSLSASMDSSPSSVSLSSSPSSSSNNLNLSAGRATTYDSANFPKFFSSPDKTDGDGPSSRSPTPQLQPISRSGSLQSLSPSPTGSFKGPFSAANRAPYPSFTSDFILFSEFSETVGPVPLFSVPDGAPGTFDLNDFVLRITAVDFQSKTTDLLSFVDTSSQLRDTQVVLSQPAENAVAYVHHFTLLDLFARGYVRPMSMSYVTHDSKKIMNHFKDFLDVFTKIANVFKEGNRTAFKADLAQKMEDVKSSYQTPQSTKEQTDGLDTEESALPSATPLTVKSYMKDLKALHKRTSGNMILSDDEEDPKSPREGDDAVVGDPDDFEFSPDYQPQLIQAIHNNAYLNQREKTEIRSIEQICGLEVFQSAVDLVRKAQAHFARPGIVLLLEREDEGVLEPPSTLLTSGNNVILNFDFEADRRNRNMEAEKNRPVDDAIEPPVMNVPSQPRARAKTIATGNRSTPTPPQHIDMSTSYAPRIDEDMRPHTHEVVNKLQKRRSLDMERSFEKSIDVQPMNVVEIAEPSRPNLFSPLSIVANWNDTENPERPALESFSSVLWGSSSHFSGKSLFALRREFSFLKHLIYSLLKGRTVVIYSSPNNEANARRLVLACSVFVVGHLRKHSSIIPWHVKPVKIADLSWLKLIGLSKVVAIPKAIERYVTVLDVDTEILNAPPYSGDFIEEIVSKKTWPDEDTYLAAIHEVLFKICSKSCLYYHLCCVGQTAFPNSTQKDEDSVSQKEEIGGPPSFRGRHSDILSEEKNSLNRTGSGSLHFVDKSQKNRGKRSLSDGNLVTIPAAVRESMKNAFFSRQNIQKNDVDIIEYVAEVVKEQQLFDLHGQKMSPTIRLDYSPCMSPSLKQTSGSLSFNNERLLPFN